MQAYIGTGAVMGRWESCIGTGMVMGQAACASYLLVFGDRLGQLGGGCFLVGNGGLFEKEGVRLVVVVRVWHVGYY